MPQPALPGVADLFDADMIDALDLAKLLPDHLARWRPLIAEGLAFFLGRLPMQRLAGIATDQFRLGIDPPPARRIACLLAHCPTLHKLGQVLARHPRLPQSLRRELQRLESMAPETPRAQVVARLRRESIDMSGLALADRLLAEGSVAAVLPFVFEEKGVLRHGVFKVLKPDIERKLAEEFAIWPDLGRHLEQRARQLGLPAIACRETLADVQTLLSNEIRLDREQAHMRAAARFYAARPDILVPRVLPWCTPRVTAMERVCGVKVTDAALGSRERRDLAATMVTALIGLPYWNKAEQTVFHADLHAGNLMVTGDGRLAVLDWSLIASLGKGQREALLAIALGGITLDATRIRAAIAALGGMRADDPSLMRIVEDALDRVVRGQLPGFDWLLQVLDEVALHTAAGFRDDLALLRKTWMSLSGVVRDLAGEVAADPILLGLGLRRFIEELPGRAFAPFGARGFSTHASNSDLLGLLVSPWLVALRFWARRMPRAWPMSAAA